MSFSSPQSSDDSATAQSNVTSVSDSAALTDFWSHFRLFPLNLEDYSFDHWYFFTIGYYIVMALLAVIFDLRHGFYHLLHDFSQTLTRFTLFDRITIFEIIGTSLIALTFNHWRHSIPGTFKTLLSKERISSTHQCIDIQREYDLFLEQYQQMLLSKKRYILIGSIVVIIMIPTFILSWPNILYVISNIRSDPFFWSVGLIYSLLAVPLAFLLEAYFIGVGSWVIVVTGIYIKRLTIQFDLRIIPGHPDNCGGLKVLGNFCWGMDFPVLILAMLLGAIGIVNLITQNIFESIITNLALFLFVLPLAAFTFFVPLWRIHRKMLEEREEYEDKFAERNAELQQRIQSSLDKQDVADAKTARDEMKILLVLHPDKIGYPAWPFDRSILFKFLTPQIIPLLSLLSGLVGPIVTALRSLFS